MIKIKKKNEENQQHRWMKKLASSKIEKEILWANVKHHLSFPDDKEKFFKDWIMKKIIIAFQN